MDPLSDVLRLLRPRTYAAGGFELGGEWALEFAAHRGIKCYALTSGSCWLAMEGVAEPVLLEAGDCILLPSGLPFRLAKDLTLRPVPFSAVRADQGAGGVLTLNGGGDTMLLGGHFEFDGGHSEILLGAMPSIIHLRDDTERAAIRWSLECMRRELRDSKPGSGLMTQYLAHTMLVQALRLYLSEGTERRVGWLFALKDPRLASALGALHAAPGDRWTLEALAERAGMSRSGFASQFKAAVGSSPMDYVLRWRMLLAGERMLARSEAVAVIASSLGYASESSFSTAFKRVMGLSPKRYVRAQTASSRISFDGAPRHQVRGH